MINKIVKKFDVVQLLSWVWLCDPMDCSMPGSLVFHCLLFWSDSCPPSQWCYLTITSSVAHFSFCLQSFLTSGSFPTSWLFTSGGQSIGALTSASVLPMNIQDWFPLGMTGLISLQCKGPSRVFSNTTVQKHEFFSVQTSLWSNSHILIWLLEKPWLWLHEPMATQSSALAWRIPGMVQPGGLPSVRSHRVGHDWSDLAAAAAYEPQQSNVSAF